MSEAPSAESLSGAAERSSERSPERSPSFSAVLAIELDRAYRVAGHILGNAADAEDAVQEALERAWSGWASLRSPDAAQGWFWRILVNTCRTRASRKRARPVRVIDDALEIPGADPFLASLDRDVVGRAMRVPSDDQRLVVVLRYWGEMTVPEIAERAGLREGTVKSRLRAAHAALRREVDRDGEALE